MCGCILSWSIVFHPYRIKLTLEGMEEEGEEEEELNPTSWHKMTPTLEISMISTSGYQSRHTQPECGYALEPSRWTEYSIHTMDPDNLELTFEFFEVIFIWISTGMTHFTDKLCFLFLCNWTWLQEDMSARVVEGDAHPGYVGTACLLSSSFSDSSKDYGVVTLPIMGRNSRQTIGKVRGKSRIPRRSHGSLLRWCLLQLTTWWSGPSWDCSVTWVPLS